MGTKQIIQRTVFQPKVRRLLGRIDAQVNASPKTRKLAHEAIAAIRPILDEVPHLTDADRKVLTREVRAHAWKTAEKDPEWIKDGHETTYRAIWNETEKVLTEAGYKPRTPVAIAVMLATLGTGLGDFYQDQTKEMRDPWSRMLNARE